MLLSTEQHPISEHVAPILADHGKGKLPKVLIFNIIVVIAIFNGFLAICFKFKISSNVTALTLAFPSIAIFLYAFLQKAIRTQEETKLDSRLIRTILAAQNQKTTFLYQ
uniref:Signal transduction histidine kinase n=1 Tax=Rhabditophanes sp. KR3021 TaxID=114890 RepID=A0AC35U113_9BILA